MSHQVFISFSSKDKKFAERVYSHLTGNNISCWISSKDIPPGADYQACIVDAIEKAKIVVLIFSTRANDSHEVAKELSLASKKTVVPTRIEDVLPQGAFQYQLSNRQFIDLFEDFDNKLNELSDRIKIALGESVDVDLSSRRSRKTSAGHKIAFGLIGFGVLAASAVIYISANVDRQSESGSKKAASVSELTSKNSLGSVAPEGVSAANVPVIGNDGNGAQAPIKENLSVPVATSEGNVSQSASMESDVPPKIKSIDLGEASVNDFQEIQATLNVLGSSRDWDRAKLLKVEFPGLPANITANSVKKLLEGTYGDSKVDAIKTIAPKMATQMNSFDVLKIVENLDGWSRQRGLEVLIGQSVVMAGLSSEEVNNILRGTSGDSRQKSIRDLAPLVVSNMSGGDVLALVRGFDGWDRQRAVNTLLAQSKIKSGLSGEELLGLLEGTSGDAKKKMISDLSSRLNGGLRGEDVAKILDGLQLWDRKYGLEILIRAGKVAKKLSPAEIDLIIQGTDGDSRVAIMKLLRA